MNRSFRLLTPQYFQHVLCGQRLEIEAVRGVVIRRHGLGIAVDHDGFIARLAQRKTGMATAIIKLDALADTVWTTTENDDLLALAWP